MTNQCLSTRPNRVICIAITMEVYLQIILNAVAFRKYLNGQISVCNELFPSEILMGYRMKDIYHSKKQGIPIRRISIAGASYTIRPSFVMPYMTGLVEDVENALFLRKFSVPFWALSYVFGRNSMYWFRMEQSLGRNSLVGTTIQNPERLPQHLSGDEKHTWIAGKKVYVATTVGDECILGVSIAENAGEKALTTAYQTFQEESHELDPDYSPISVNTDGWAPTQSAWKNLFPKITVILCLLHVFIKMRDRGKKKFKELFEQAADKLWEAYRAENKASFVQRIRRLHEWGQKQLPDTLFSPIDKLRKNIDLFKNAYDLENPHRTSNMLDRLMQRMDRHLFSSQYFHGNLKSAELGIRAWALIYNFAPSNPGTVKKHAGRSSPAQRLNQFQYHDSWLQNLLISASLGGFN